MKVLKRLKCDRGGFCNFKEIPSDYGKRGYKKKSGGVKKETP